MTIGLLRSDEGQVHIRNPQAAILTALNSPNPLNVEGNACPRGEQAILRSFAEVLAQLSNPLVITCGGRRQDLLLLRYRCLACLVSLDALHLSVGNRWKYFDRFDSSWHLDVADLLAGYGASSELTLDDLSRLCALEFLKLNLNNPPSAADESNAILALFFRFLFLTGRMDKPAYEIALAELHELAKEGPCFS
jgi:hypothetical protein